jgi:aryl-alcohol dehydrogenase-like predicted oxidoreductase
MKPTTSTRLTETLPQRVLGRIGRPVSILGLGGGGLLSRTHDERAAVELVNHAIDAGVNYLDTAPTYGPSEEHIGKVMRHRRDEVFLATKVYPRIGDEAHRTIENSLRRLQTDRIDLIQVHDMATREEIDRMMSPDGSLAAMIEAREQGIVRWIGVTGHKDPDALIYAIERFDFDTVLMPVNIADRHYLSFVDGVLPPALERNMGVIAMKVFCAGGVFESLDVTPAEALRYALSFPVATAIVGVDDLRQLDENLRTARDFRPMDEDERQAVLDRTREKAAVCGAKFKREPD